MDKDTAKEIQAQCIAYRNELYSDYPEVDKFEKTKKKLLKPCG